jgi:mRNA interferase MazF
MTNFEPGSVVLVRFPFTDLTAAKRRPALVVSPSDFSSPHGDVVVLALTSRPQKEDRFRLEHWRAAGLPRQTWVKPVIGTISRSLVVRRLGRLAAQDMPWAVAAIRALIAKDFLS